MTAFAAHSTRVLVIDDDPILRDLLCALLGAEGYEVLSAGSGEEGLARMHGGFAAEVVLADVQLPGLAGPALAAELRNLASSACLLCMSGSEAPPAARAAFDGFLLKPFSTEDFASALDTSRMDGQTTATGARSPAGSATVPLDEGTYSHLARSLPAAQLAELYHLSLDDIDSRIRIMRDSLATQDTDTYRREAHALKGGCAMVGAVELARLAARSEAGASDDTPALEEFSDAAARLRSIMTARFILQNAPQ